ncbi:hypothetical protein AMATHDRAFT_142240, partial [Amanita thiersii Skay4041]
TQMRTRYMNMLLALDDIPQIYNIGASFFTWILLAGFVLFPGTFSSLRDLPLGSSSGGGVPQEVARNVLNAVNHVSLFVIAFICCGVGAAGMCYLWWRWMNNYVWLTNKIFIPGLLNSLAGVISTIANVYGVQDGQFSTTSKVTIIVTVVSTAVCGVLCLFYMFWMIRKVKKEHDEAVGKQRAGRHGEGIIERIKRTRKANRKVPNGAFV